MPDTDRRKENWHMEKGVPLALIVTVLFAFGANIYTYASTMQEIKSFMKLTDQRFADQDEKIREGTADRIYRSTVLAMFETRDAKINNVAESITSLSTTIGSNTVLLQQILREMPRKSE